MSLFRDRVRVFEKDLHVFFEASNLLYGAKATQIHISAIPDLSGITTARITFSLVNMDFVFSNGRLVDVAGGMFRFSSWSRNPNFATELSYDLVRACNEWPPIFRVDDMRNLLDDRVQSGATAAGTPTVDLSTLTALNATLDGASREVIIGEAVNVYALLQDVQDDLDNLDAATSQQWLTGLTTLRGRVKVGHYLVVEDLGDQSFEDRIYELDTFSRQVIVRYVRSD